MGRHDSIDQIKRRKYLEFKNRENVIEKIMDDAQCFLSDNEFYKIYQIVGVGGSGKSRLLSKLQEDFLDIGVDYLKVSLEKEATSSFINVLNRMKSKLPFNCLFFDTAVIKYGQLSGKIEAMSLDEDFADNYLFKFAEEARKFLGIINPSLLIPISFGFIGDTYKKLRPDIGIYANKKEVLKEINSISDLEELTRLIPHYLADDIEINTIGNKLKVAFLFDSYEKISEETKKSDCLWLQVVLNAFKSGFFIFFTREEIIWEGSELCKDFQETLSIDKLPEKDALELFSENTEANEHQKKQLLQLSNAIPFYIEIAIDNFNHEAAKKGNSADVVLPRNIDKALDKFIGHINKTEKNLAIWLGLVQFFDLELIRFIFKNNNILDLESGKEIVNRFFIETADEELGIYKVHDLLSKFIRTKFASSEVSEEAILTISDFLSKVSLRGSNSTAYLPTFFGACKVASELERKETIIENMLDYGYWLYDLGYWKELRKTFFTESNESSGYIINQYFKSISERRISNVQAGLDGLKKLEKYKSSFGRQEIGFDLEVAYLIELSGDYPLAKKIIKKTFNKCKPINILDRAHFRALLYHSDMLAMSGRFQKSNRLLVASQSETQLLKNQDLAELIRHRGHVYRFSFLFDEAYFHYLNAYKASIGIQSMEAKLQTNFVETNCWLNPSHAIKDAKKALRENEYLGNRIEICKILSARSIAYTLMGNIDEAESDQRRAQSLGKDTGYKAGKLFSFIPKLLIAKAKNNKSSQKLIQKSVEELIDEIGIYHHLSVLCEIILEQQEKYENSMKEFSWIEKKGFVKRVEFAIRNIT